MQHPTTSNLILPTFVSSTGQQEIDRKRKLIEDAEGLSNRKQDIGI